MDGTYGLTPPHLTGASRATPGLAEGSEAKNTTPVPTCISPRPPEGASVSHARSSISERCYLYCI